MLSNYSCPVPKEQRPINEYCELIQSTFFSLPLNKERIFQEKVGRVLFFFFLFFFPFSFFFDVKNTSFLTLFLLSLVLSLLSLFLVLLRLFLAWNYIEKRLYNPTIFYEESGWYDGRYWIKSKNILVQDRLIHAYQVLPSLKKLQRCGLWTFFFLLFSFFCLFFA
jgi:uncharacterized membrane protein YbhN (UPF0104 family)